jgi:hypothetical protein
VKVKRIEFAGYANVYNMHVEETHSFAVEGGLIVHNCYDETRYACMSRPIQPMKKEPEKDRIQKHKERIMKQNKHYRKKVT